jgi:ribosome-associated heat shock protein Hsp15
MRLDKWLWYSWISKSRTAAGDLCKAGRVQVNSGPGKAAKEVQVGDMIEIAFSGRTGKFKILQLLSHRGPKGSHEGSYEDLSPEVALSPEKKKVEMQYKKEAQKLKYRYGDGRESKKDKRKQRELLG